MQLALAVTIVSPMSQSAPLWSYVNFTCEGIGKALTWVVQYINLPVNLINSTNTSSSYNLSSVLTVQALPDEDGARILCLIFADDYSSLLSATVANLTIKGECKKILLVSPHYYA